MHTNAHTTPINHSFIQILIELELIEKRTYAHRKNDNSKNVESPKAATVAQCAWECERERSKEKKMMYQYKNNIRFIGPDTSTIETT